MDPDPDQGLTIALKVKYRHILYCAFLISFLYFFQSFLSNKEKENIPKQGTDSKKNFLT
jgi:hypothetical protein